MTDRDPARNDERRMLLLHVPARRRAAVAALLALNERLCRLATSGREPMLRRIRLAWWRDALAALDHTPPPPEPLLVALATDVIPNGVAGSDLAAVATGWDFALAGPIDVAMLDDLAAEAGGALFARLADLLGGDGAGIRSAGQGCMLAALARSMPSGETRSLVTDVARARLDDALATRWPRRLRPLAMLAALARSDLAGARPGTPARAALLWRIRIAGR